MGLVNSHAIISASSTAKFCLARSIFKCQPLADAFISDYYRSRSCSCSFSWLLLNDSAAFHYHKRSGFGAVDCRNDQREIGLENIKVDGGKRDNCYSPTGKVLLVSKVFIAG